MRPSAEFRIAVMPGDGIGREIMPACLALLERVAHQTNGFALRFEELPAGAYTYKETGNALPASTMAAAKQADAILFGAMGWPAIRYPNGTEIAPQLDLRFDLGLYAGVRPIRALPGVPLALRDARAEDIDFVLIRESTEGLFASRGRGVVEGNHEARDTMVITRRGSERVFDFAFRLARQRRRRDSRAPVVTCVDKSNVFASFAFFREIFVERAALFPDVKAGCAYIDAMALDLVRRPWELDVLVTENMFGDILSDLGAGLVGGMGMAPSGDVGDEHALFQPCHGTAPDIAGQGKANPTAMFLSAAMMLEWLAVRHGIEACAEAADTINTAIHRAYSAGTLRPCEFGGSDGTAAIARAVLAAMEEPAAKSAAS